MKTPAALQPLIDDGVIDEVIRSLKSDKEATVYLVRSGTHTRCAKVYRDMRHGVASRENARRMTPRPLRRYGTCDVTRERVSTGCTSR
jgi:serine/threonine-protein kinase RIO1